MFELNLKIKAVDRAETIELLKTALAQVTNGDDEIYERLDNSSELEGNIIDFDEQRKTFEEEAGYPLSENQLRFCIDADEQGFELNYTYSGRGMFGKTCPSTKPEDGAELETSAKIKKDSLGLGIIIYAQS